MLENLIMDAIASLATVHVKYQIVADTLYGLMSNLRSEIEAIGPVALLVFGFILIAKKSKKIFKTLSR